MEIIMVSAKFGECETACRKMGTDLPPIYEPPRPADIRHSYASIHMAGSLLGYQPQMDVREGLRRTIEWFKVHEC